ncbi:YybH family protein [Paenisporosarcina indica]|uniref:YybH family protein n=1 Tax=Paenisporosarcina indica TaxID=650093 RepID=UPI00095021D0|nr:nuclear transport factor 2 family protein [Paenisporosarcina indica]
MTNETRLVQDVLEIYKCAIFELDTEKFLSIYAEDVHIYDCWGNWECKGISLWKDSVTEWFNGLNEDRYLLKVDFMDLTIEENTNVAFVHCAVTFAAFRENTEDKLRQMTNRFTFGLKKVNESWLITHEHSSLPIDMQSGKGIFNPK